MSIHSLGWCCSVLLVCSGLNACRPARPAAHTPAYQEAHGIVPGQASHIRIGNRLFRLPAGMASRVWTAGEIHPGQADSLSFSMDYSHLLGQPALAPSATVEVSIEKVVQPRIVPPLARKDPRWKAVIPRPEWGLEEWRDRHDDGGWGYVTYQSLASATRPPSVEPIQFRCQGLPTQAPIICQSEYPMPTGEWVGYSMPYALMPHWAKIRADVKAKLLSMSQPS